MAIIKWIPDMLTAAGILTAYLLGAIPFGLIIARMYGVADIRQHGSRNIGATNVLRVIGAKAAAWVFAADIGKGVAAVLIARLLIDGAGVASIDRDAFLIICGVASILGHVFSIFLHFKGGKGVNTALGAMITLLPIPCLIALIIFGAVFLAFRIVSLASILATSSLFFILWGQARVFSEHVAAVYYYVSIGLALLIIVTHRANIARILSGTENRFSFRSKS